MSSFSFSKFVSCILLEQAMVGGLAGPSTGDVYAGLFSLAGR
jgi:hypothetical protein